MKFLSNPNLPEESVCAVLVDYRTAPEIIASLEKLGITVYKSCKVDKLDETVCGHVDMSIHHIGKNIFVCEPSTYDYYKHIFQKQNINLIRGNSVLTSTYPHDAAYNIARIGNYAFHASCYTDKVILNTFDKLNITLLHTQQGYSKCNLCPITKNAFITEDESIYKVGVNHSFDVLKITKGYIQLPGYPYGFIGGATGLIDKNILAVTGSLRQHPDYNKIIAFCKKYHISVCELTQQKPIDIGSILPIYESFSSNLPV